MPTMQPLASYSDLELALMVLLGYYGNGAARKQKLGSRYATVQGIVEQILRGAVPAGSREFNRENVKAAVYAVFDKSIEEITEDIINELK